MRKTGRMWFSHAVWIHRATSKSKCYVIISLIDHLQEKHYCAVMLVSLAIRFYHHDKTMTRVIWPLIDFNYSLGLDWYFRLPNENVFICFLLRWVFGLNQLHEFSYKENHSLLVWLIILNQISKLLTVMCVNVVVG